MMQSLWVAKTGLAAQDMNLTTISNNLANVSTTGFRYIECRKHSLISSSA